MPQRHLFVCTNPRSSGKPACGAAGDALIAAVQRLLIERDVADVLVTPCGCLGPCFDGPNAVIYPDAIWYSHLAIEDAPRLVDHLTSGIFLSEKIAEAPGSSSEDD